LCKGLPRFPSGGFFPFFLQFSSSPSCPTWWVLPRTFPKSPLDPFPSFEGNGLTAESKSSPSFSPWGRSPPRVFSLTRLVSSLPFYNGGGILTLYRCFLFFGTVDSVLPSGHGRSVPLPAQSHFATQAQAERGPAYGPPAFSPQ